MQIIYHRLAGDVCQVLDVVVLVLLQRREEHLPHLLGLGSDAPTLFLLASFVLDLFEAGRIFSAINY